MLSTMTTQRLHQENRTFHSTGGVSEGNRDMGFRPAFRDTETGRVELSCFAPGVPAPVHLIAGVPEEWVVERDAVQGVTAVKSTVIAGFVRAGRFYTRAEAANALEREQLANRPAAMVN